MNVGKELMWHITTDEYYAYEAEGYVGLDKFFSVYSHDNIVFKISYQSHLYSYNINSLNNKKEIVFNDSKIAIEYCKHMYNQFVNNILVYLNGVNIKPLCWRNVNGGYIGGLDNNDIFKIVIKYTCNGLINDGFEVYTNPNTLIDCSKYIKSGAYFKDNDDAKKKCDKIHVQWITDLINIFIDKDALKIKHRKNIISLVNEQPE